MQNGKYLEFAIKLNYPQPFEGHMDFEVTDALICNLDNYFQITGLTDENK